MDLSFELDRTATEPLYRQLYQQLRRQIVEGALHPGSRLPSTRLLAEHLSIGRITATQAYDQLQAEGYVLRQRGAGTFVACSLPLQHEPQLPRSDPSTSVRLSGWGQRVMQLERKSERANVAIRPETEIDFGFGRSFPHVFPFDIWRSLLARYLSTDDVMLSRYGSAAGFHPLREAISDYLARLRGVDCRPEDVVIVNGAQQALDIISRLILDKGDKVLVETPGYTDAFAIFQAHGVQLEALNVDQHGFPVEQIPANSSARVAFVTPANQFPHGGAMPAERRLALLQWAQNAGALIIEDDYDGPLRYEGQPLAALQGLDKSGYVIYLGTFSKVLFPALRLGYVVLPPMLLQPFVKAKAVVDRGAPTLTQAAVADFITEGHFERHLRRLRKEYGRHWQTIVAAVKRFLGDRVSFAAEPAGLHVMLYLHDGLREERVVAEAAKDGVRVYEGAPYHLQKPAPASILLGFSGLGEQQIEEGVRRLGQALNNALD